MRRVCPAGHSQRADKAHRQLFVTSSATDRHLTAVPLATRLARNANRLRNRNELHLERLSRAEREEHAPVLGGEQRRIAVAQIHPRIRRGKDGDPVQRDVRVSDAERQDVVRRLERAMGDGRLTIVEFDERTRAAYGTRTRGELDDLTEDLPPDLW